MLFDSSEKRIDSLKKKGAEFIMHIDAFRKVFQQKKELLSQQTMG